MTSSWITKLLLLYALIVIIPCAAAQEPIQFTLHQDSTKPNFRAELYNTGKLPLHLSFGFQYELGHAMSAIRIEITDVHGKKISLEMRDPYVGAALRGQTVSLPETMVSPGHTYSFSINLDDYLTQPLAPGQYSLQAIYVGEDLPHNTEPRYWVGTVISNALPFTIPSP